MNNIFTRGIPISLILVPMIRDPEVFAYHRKKPLKGNTPCIEHVYDKSYEQIS